MCATEGTGAATASSIFQKIDDVLSQHDISWSKCIGFGVDNTSVNVGCRNSIMTRVKEKNEACYFMGCPCHLLHNIACKASEAFCDVTDFNLEDMCIDTYYYFDKSSKRKSLLDEFAKFCEVDYRQIIKHVNTRWLSLEIAVRRHLDMYPALKSLFLSNSENSPRFKRLKKHLSDPMVEVYHLFYQAVLPTFSIANKFLQKEDPCIHAAHDQLNDFVTRILGKFVRIDKIKAAQTVEDVEYSNQSCQLKDSQLFVGFATRQKVDKLVREGDVDERKRVQFYQAVRKFYETAIREAIAKLPLHDDTLIHAKFVDFFQREQASFEDVEFFLTQYSAVLLTSARETQMLQEEFVAYQLFDNSNIPSAIWDEARMKIQRDEATEEGSSNFRMDVIWGYLSSLKLSNGTYKFGRLSKVAKAVLVLPHSNAGEERVFSMIRKNKTSFRPSLQINGTLSSLLTIKMAGKDASFEPPKELLSNAKKATWNYNKTHASKE